MSFQVYPQPDACRALMPTPEPHPPGPPSRPMACHMPKGHDGPHALTRRPGPLDRRWEGDARPDRPAPSPAAAGLPAEDVERVARAMWEDVAGENPDAASWAEAADYVHDFYRQIAVAALAEMRPTAARDVLRSELATAIKANGAWRERLQRVEALIAEEEAHRADLPAWEISVLVPAEAGDEIADRIFDAVADAAYETQPDDREDWDIFVSASKNPTYVMTHQLRRALDGTP